MVRAETAAIPMPQPHRLRLFVREPVTALPSVRPSGACVTVSASGSPALASRLTMASGRLGRVPGEIKAPEIVTKREKCRCVSDKNLL